jgi:hypothetical protein
MEAGPSPDDAERDPDLAELEDLERDVAALEDELDKADSTEDAPVTPAVSGPTDEPSAP